MFKWENLAKMTCDVVKHFSNTTTMLDQITKKKIHCILSHVDFSDIK